MKTAIVFITLTFLVCCSTAQDYAPTTFDSSESDSSSSGTDLGSISIQFVTQLLSSDFFQKKLQTLFDLVDLKLRMVTIIKSLFTPENLLLARRMIDWVSRLCTFIGKFLPELPENETAGNKFSIFSLLFNSGPTNNHIVDENANEIVSTSTQKPPTKYGPPTMKPFIGGAETKVEVNVKRSAELPEEDRKLIKNYSDDVVNLTKLIYARNN